LHQSPEVRRQIQSTIDGVNKRVGQVAQVKKFTILPRELSIEDGELTGTLKVKRNRVTEHFAAEIEALYSGD
jgi:long-chain acyl-CoA synthetase